MSKRYPINHESGKPDNRWQVTREFTGRATRCYVIRFCDEWRGRFDTWQEAAGAAAYGEDCRRRAIYHDGKALRDWQALDDSARSSWIRNPTPRDWPQGVAA